MLLCGCAFSCAHNVLKCVVVTKYVASFFKKKKERFVWYY